VRQPTGWHRRPRNSLYSTSAWRELSKSVVRGRACVYCGKLATQADHIIPADVRPDLFFDRSNLQPTCRSCNARRAAERSNLKKPYRPRKPVVAYWV
jgi:5-methylcytosine-specific restriction endonuclease McrA